MEKDITETMVKEDMMPKVTTEIPAKEDMMPKVTTEIPAKVDMTARVTTEIPAEAGMEGNRLLQSYFKTYKFQSVFIGSHSGAFFHVRNRRARQSGKPDAQNKSRTYAARAGFRYSTFHFSPPGRANLKRSFLYNLNIGNPRKGG